MAKKNINIPNDLIDFYAVYQLDRKMDTKEIRKRLMQQQGEIRSNMANGSLNSPEILEKLQEAFNTIAKAVKTFKNDERRKVYDRVLDAAYEEGKINTEAQSLAQDLYEEIKTMFLKGDYKGVIRKCMEALNNNARDYRLYMLLAQSYFALNDPDNSLRSVEDGLNVHPDNIPLLQAGARFSNEGKHDFDKSQQYINKMMQIDPNSSITVSEQSYLYVTSGKDDLAYQMIDDYIEKHPNDLEFRRNVAYDLIGHSYSCYTKDPNSNAFVIASEENYNKCLDIRNRASSIYNDENVQNALENAKYFGTVEFNEENRKNIKWLRFGGILYLITGIMYLLQGIASLSPSVFGAIIIVVLGILLLYSEKKLKQLSYRPYWQINKFILTGQREPEEAKYVMIGKIFTGYIEWTFKLLWWMFTRLLPAMENAFGQDI